MTDSTGKALRPGEPPLRPAERRALLLQMRDVAVAAGELAEFKRRTRAAWAAGDYHAVSRPFWGVGARIVGHVRVRPGDEVIDVACGTGNAAIRAAEAGATVVGVDLTPELFTAGRALAAEAGVTVEWREGDAEALPFPDERFDVVLSTFGCMFAPRHEVAAAELDRVLRPMGRIGLASWTSEGALGEFFRVLASHLPPPPPFASPPILWGSEDHVRRLFDGSGIDLEFSRESVDFRFDSLDDAIESTIADFGPLVKARELLEPEGRWEALRQDLVAFFEDHDQADGREVVFPGEYLVALGRKPA